MSVRPKHMGGRRGVRTDGSYRDHPDQFREDTFEESEQTILKKVVLFGHSYVKYLPTDPRPVTLPDNPKEAFTVKPVYVSGGRVATVRQTEEFQFVLDYKPDVTYLIFGGNDIDKQTHPKTLAQHREQLAQEIESRTGGIVRIVGIESRTNPWYVTPEEFNKIKNSINRFLKKVFPWSKVRYSSMNMSKEELTCDGVHLNREGCQALVKRLVEDAKQILNEQ